MRNAKNWFIYPLALALLWNVVNAQSKETRDGTVTLPEIVVIASKIPVPSDEIGSSISTVSEEELSRSQAVPLRMYCARFLVSR